jgi:hypothetical protein
MGGVILRDVSDAMCTDGSSAIRHDAALRCCASRTCWLAHSVVIRGGCIADCPLEEVGEAVEERGRRSR